MSESYLCRLCANLTGAHNSGKIFERSRRKLLRQIADLTGLKLRNAKDLPQHICQLCEEQTLQAHRFRERCIRTQKFFAQRSDQLGDPSTKSKKPKLHDRQKSEDEQLPSCEKVLANINRIKIEERQGDDERKEDKITPVEDVLLPKLIDEQQQREEVVMPNIAEVLLKGEPIESDDSGSGSDVNSSDGYNPLDEKSENSCPSAEEHSMASDGSEFKPLEPEISLITEDQTAKEKQKVERNKTQYKRDKPLKKLKKEKKPKEPKQHNLICDQCGKHFKCPRQLDDHLLRHAGDKQHQCKICPQRFYSYQALHRHTRTHSGEKPFGCRYCDRHFMDDSSRVRHERVHTNTRPFVCAQCGKAFTVSPSLKEHMRIHTGERAFVCKICNVSFTLKAHLKTHYRSMTHKQNEERQENSHNQPAPAVRQDKTSSDWQFV